MTDHAERAAVAAKRAVVFAALSICFSALGIGLLVWKAVR